jgi:hypothetical protein
LRQHDEMASVLTHGPVTPPLPPLLQEAVSAAGEKIDGVKKALNPRTLAATAGRAAWAAAMRLPGLRVAEGLLAAMF